MWSGPLRRCTSGVAAHCDDVTDRPPAGRCSPLQIHCNRVPGIGFRPVQPYRGPMVIRILRTRVRPDSVHLFRPRAIAKAVDARKVAGSIDVHVGQQADGAAYEFVFVSRWESMDALYAWAGGLDLLARPIYFEGLEDALLDFEIQHYVDLESTD